MQEREVNSGGADAVPANAPALQAVFTAFPTPTALFAADAPRFTVVAASDALLAVSGRPREAVIGKPLAEAFPNAQDDGDGLSGLVGSLWEAVRTGRPQRMARHRYDLQRPDGAWEARYWDATNTPVPGPDGRVGHVLHQTEDVTAMVVAEQGLEQSRARLRHSEERFQAMVTQATVGIAETQGGRFTYVNDRFCEITGRAREGIIGLRVADISHPDDGPRDMELIARMYATGGPFAVDKRYVRPDGSVVWVLNSVSPIRDAAGEIIGGFAVSTDVTERKAAEESLRRAYERERAIARELQRPLTVAAAGDTFPGLTIATHYEAASGEADVGGDFFDAFDLPRGRVALAIADASGKGLQAAARAVQVKEVLRAFTREHPHSPAHIAARVNDYVYASKRPGPVGSSGGELFVTLILVVLDPHTGEASVVSAGGDPPLLLRAGEGSSLVEPPRPGSLPLGVQEGEVYHSVPLRLDHGDTLLLTTDGVPEARQDKARFLGMDGVAALAAGALRDAPTLQAAAERIVGEARVFGNGRFRDDVCLLLARRK